MRHIKLICSSILSAAVFIGCDSKKDETPVTPPSTPTAATPPAAPADAMKSATDNAAATAGKTADSAAATANNTAAGANNAAAGAADTANKATADANTGATNAMNAVGSADASAQATSMIQKAMQYIKENKLDDADNLLKKLQGMKSSLPASIQKQIDNAQTAFNGAKAANSVKMPEGVPAMGK